MYAASNPTINVENSKFYNDAFNISRIVENLHFTKDIN